VTGTKAKWLKWLAAVGLVFGLVAAGVLRVNHGRVGRALDSHRGVPVYDNGLLFFRSYGRHYSADGYYYGQKWQCVEYVKRFYHQAKGHKMPDLWGHARDYFDPALADGALNPRRGLVQYRNGASAKPHADDLVVFTDTRFGHVAIVSEVASDSLEVVQQNILGKPRQRLSLACSNGCWFVSAPRRPAGWLRLPESRDSTPAR
jgi:surface antigen